MEMERMRDMASFSLVIEYLTGYAVATDPATRERAEWPPHPARVYMAMAAAHFETDVPTGQKQAEREALEWLATLDPPDLVVPNHAVRDVLDVYVPVNDMELPALKTIQNWNSATKSGSDSIKAARTIVPAYRTNKQPRTFPRVYVGNEPVRLIYRVDPTNASKHVRALESLCRHVTRIGHSSSLVWMRLERHGQDASPEPTHRRDESNLGRRCRVPDGRLLARLERDYNVKPTSRRPVVSLHSAYAEASHRLPLADEGPASPFDPNFLVLRFSHDSQQTLGLESTIQLVSALRKHMMDVTGRNNSPAWVSGHEPNGDKLQSGDHIAIIPLAFVGRPWIGVEQHADGHLLGLGLLIPRDVPMRDRARIFAPIFFDDDNAPKPIPLSLARAGNVTVERDTRFEPPRTLRADTYALTSTSWASITPVLLDRMPKADRRTDAPAWRDEVAGIIADSCTRVGLPIPVTVRVEKTPFFHGSLRAMPGQGGFPQLRKDKFQVHVQLDFSRPVTGPVLLGAGRFRGYGLMGPWQQPEG
jgi:CRISPR-associated protein Csb2